MTIDLKTVKHISKLSRISIDDKKAKKLTDDLNSIFKFIEKLNQLDTKEVEPLTSIAKTNLKSRTAFMGASTEGRRSTGEISKLIQFEISVSLHLLFSRASLILETLMGTINSFD